MKYAYIIIDSEGRELSIKNNNKREKQNITTQNGPNIFHNVKGNASFIIHVFQKYREIKNKVLLKQQETFCYLACLFILTHA